MFVPFNGRLSVLSLSGALAQRTGLLVEFQHLFGARQCLRLERPLSECGIQLRAIVRLTARGAAGGPLPGLPAGSCPDLRAARVWRTERVTSGAPPCRPRKARTCRSSAPAACPFALKFPTRPTSRTQSWPTAPAPLAHASLALRCLTGAHFTSHRDCEACHAYRWCRRPAGGSARWR